MERLLTLYELADYLKLDKFTIYRMVYRRQLPAIKVANQWRFKEKDIEKWLGGAEIKSSIIAEPIIGKLGFRRISETVTLQYPLLKELDKNLKS